MSFVRKYECSRILSILRQFSTCRDKRNINPLHLRSAEKPSFGTIRLALWKATPCGIHSIDDGKTWKKLLGGLPPVVCVKSVVLGEPHASARQRIKAPASAGRSKSSA